MIDYILAFPQMPKKKPRILFWNDEGELIGAEVKEFAGHLDENNQFYTVNIYVEVDEQL